MTYGKITSTAGIMLMPNPVKIVFSNPTEEQKAKIADLDNWLECVYTDAPEYDPETQYITDSWTAEEVEGKTKAVQHWTIHEIPEPEVTDEAE